MSEITPLFAGGGQQTTAQRLDRFARLQALSSLCKGEMDRIREELELEADTIESVTGGAYNVKVPSTGQVYRTAPEPSVYVRDEDELLDWLDDVAPDLVVEHEKLVVKDEQLAVNLIGHLSHDSAPEPDWKRVRLDMQRCFRIDTVRSVDGDSIFDALEHYGLAKVHAGVAITEDGEVVPGTETRQGRRQLTVRITDKDRFIDELTSMLPALAERSEA